MNEINKKELSEMDIRTKYITFPVTYDGENGALFVRTNEQHVKRWC